MQRVLIISTTAGEYDWLAESSSLSRHQFDIAGNKEECLQLLAQVAYDLVITNPSTSIEDDLAFIKELRADYPQLLFIIIAPESTSDDLIAVMRAHVFACFSTPFSRAELTAMTERALEQTNWKDGIEVLSSSRDWIALSVKPRRLTAERLVRFMNELRSDLPDPERDALITAFREILLNAMEHGAGFNPDLVIQVSAVQSSRAIVFYFRDPGPGFNRDNLPHAAIANSPDNPVGHIEYRELHGMRPGGFGIMLTKQLVDEVVYNELGNEVLLIKHKA